MKTIETTQGKLFRMSDAKAQQWVDTGEGKYVPKSRWKTEVRDIQTAEVVQLAPDAKIVVGGVKVKKESKSERIQRKREERNKAR